MDILFGLVVMCVVYRVVLLFSYVGFRVVV